ncbi:alpha-ketoglutarate-dependent dioxygenase AlkB family protein [Candidatus Marimicrobium litorale]|uniref:Alpha-ketoglutarate-dependent dioxygenase AlkB n=1 Tax=Candidatus Marimicrobium litorale TaxID=2518991 RepID=A0ABT3T8Z1_9GAMM|nr:alpha-ketoglutarate-dependent dioxygenase AlkB [Candidatus Marimicrobium litorale]MCX2978305.1 alpha-ketoglutarate-dependent dioxygenase AlkB [Candidatus Marimicrobium litorale]
MDDLFSNADGQKLHLPDADLVFWHDVLPDDHTSVLQRLIEETPWRQEHVTLWGKTYPQPRLVAWYADAGLSYSYSGVILEATPFTSALLEIKARVEALCCENFNSVLLNYYRDHRDSMGFHADDEPELGACPSIASLSLGAERTFVMKHRSREDVGDLRVRLTSGSLLLMRGETQSNWKHGIPKTTKPLGPRVNLTFRQIISPVKRGKKHDAN